MALPLIPFAVGLAAGAAATYLYKDREARERTTKAAVDIAKGAGYAAGAIKGLLSRKPRKETVVLLSSEEEHAAESAPGEQHGG